MKLVCKRHGIELEVRRLADEKRHRLYCTRCLKFVYNREVVELDDRMWGILNELNKIDKHLNAIWDMAFHDPVRPKMQNGIPEYDLGDVFVKVHQSQRSILGWYTSSQIWKHGD